MSALELHWKTTKLMVGFLVFFMLLLMSPLILLQWATPVSSQTQQQIPAPIVFSIKGGETLQLRWLGQITADCVNQFVELTALDILEGPPEITVKPEGIGALSMSTIAGKVCPPTPGVWMMITAGDVTQMKEANLTIRVRYAATYSKTATWTYRFHLLMYPGEAKKQAQQ